MRYIPNTKKDQQEMLKAVGVDNIEDFLSPLPEKILLNKPLDLPSSLSEKELVQLMKKMADKNLSFDEFPSFLGGGAYQHFIPSIIDHIISRSEFYTAYTPYQAELSQGTLQSMYEYQTMICELTSMNISNASLYEGGSAAAEAAIMAQNITGNDEILVSETVHPEYREVLETYRYGRDYKLKTIPREKGTKISPQMVSDNISKDTACVLIQYPNFFGSLEEAEKICSLLNEKQVLSIIIANPITLGILKPPGELGADIACGEAQSLGSPLSFGGPYLGYIASKEKYLRQIPGRLSGLTEDQKKQRGFVLTLQAREQHIRREKASSNICSNEALNALAAAVYMAAMGPEGLREAAEQSLKKAHYTAEKINQLSGFKVVSDEPFFHEFVVSLPEPAESINKKLLKKEIIGGLDMGRFNKDWKERMLVCVTEIRTKDEIDNLIETLEVL